MARNPELKVINDTLRVWDNMLIHQPFGNREKPVLKVSKALLEAHWYYSNKPKSKTVKRKSK